MSCVWGPSLGNVVTHPVLLKEKRDSPCCSLCLGNKSACTEGRAWVTHWSLLRKIREGTKIAFSSPPDPALAKGKQGKYKAIPFPCIWVCRAEHQLLLIFWKSDANKSIPSCSHLPWASTRAEGAWIHSPSGKAFFFPPLFFLCFLFP